LLTRPGAVSLAGTREWLIEMGGPDDASLAQPSPPSARLLAGVALLSLCVLLLQLTLTRLFSATMYYHFAFLAIALALFGSGAGGVLVFAARRRLLTVPTAHALVAAALLFSGTTVLALVVILENPFSPVDPPGRTLRHLAFVFTAAGLPFLSAGVALALAVARFPRSMSHLYLFDLGGAAAGCLLVIPLLDRLGAVDTVLLVAILAWGAAVVLEGTREVGGLDPGARRRLVALSLGGLLAIGTFGANRAFALLDVRQPKGLDEAGNVLFEKWNSFSRVTVWGSLAGPSLLVLIDADAGTLVLSGGDVPGKSEFLTSRLEGLVYRLKPGARALVIGPGGGADVATARALGAVAVTAVEVNPIIARDVMSREPFRSFAGALYEQPGVRLVVDEARSFIRSDRERYDVIQATMVDTWAATAAGAFALAENNLYTVEAFTDYLGRLAPDGMVSFTRWYLEPPDQVLRLAAIARAALAERGVGDAARHVLVVRGPFDVARPRAPVTLLLKASPFTDAEVETVAAQAAARGFVLLFTPVHRPPGALTSLLTAPDPAEVWRALPGDVSPSRDDHPFFFHTVRLRGLTDLRVGRDDEWQKTNLGTLVLIALLGLTVAATAAFIVGPLAFLRAGPARGRAALLLGFVGLGLGYVVVEVVLVQKCILLLGHPVYALSVVLFSLLAWSGLGSLASGRVPEDRLPAFLPWCLLGAAALVVVYALGLSPLIRALAGQPRGARILAAALVLAPLGLVLGAPMPTAVRLLARAAPSSIPWAWGVNGAASVLGSVAALVLALGLGFDRALVGGALAYVGARWAFRSLGESA
jgi:hypothetical protein